MAEKIALVTGANSGLGKATVVMVCRGRERGETARTEIVAASGKQVQEHAIGCVGEQRRA